MASRSLLVELLVEELPPKALKMLGASFAELIFNGLKNRELLSKDSVSSSFATPRRLAVHITQVLPSTPPKTIRQKLVPVSVGFDAEGKPTAALKKKISALGFDISVIPDLKRVPDGKTEILVWEGLDSGFLLESELIDVLNDTVTTLPIPKVMSYQLEESDINGFQPGWTTVHFVRPAHSLIVLYGAESFGVPGFVLGLRGGNKTQGHRFEAKKEIIQIESADSYVKQLETDGAVIASFDTRRAEIVKQLEAAGRAAGLQPIQDDALLDEVTALVERPNVLVCKFEKEFLDVPQECLILTMKANQKYFPLLDANGKLSNQFLVVSNIRPSDPSRVVEGNERVVRPRLADAKFFYDQDRKKPLGSHLEALGRVVYHNKLGSQLDRVRRIEVLAEIALKQLPAVSNSTVGLKEAAQLCKCDLLTNMVGEFPELQGIMGRYYALADGKDDHVAQAIREHYLPRGANDDLPKTDFGIALALADKGDTIAGVFAINQRPTGAKDPFGVRRAAIGIVRILVESAVNLDLIEFVKRAVLLQPDQNAPGTIVQPPPLTLGVSPWYVLRTEEIYDYIMERLRAYYLEGGSELKVTTEMFDAVLANRPASPLDFDKRLNALAEFLRLSDAQSLAAANKRISNILRKSGQETFGQVNAELLRDPAEQVLSEQVNAMSKVTEPLFATRDYTQALTKLASLRAAVDAFFDGVMVMAEDKALQANRLALLSQLRGLFARVADLSRLPG